jgi:hypothetical protein
VRPELGGGIAAPRTGIMALAKPMAVYAIPPIDDFPDYVKSDESTSLGKR